MSQSAPRRTRAGGARKRPARYTDTAADEALARGLRAHRKGAFTEATTAYLDALARDPRSLDAWMNLAAAYALRGLERAARESFARARALAHDNARALRDVGIGLAAVGAYTEARDALAECLARDASAIGARLTLARVCAEDGAADEALAHAERATRDAPHDASAWIELHRALFCDARVAACLGAAERAVALDPTHANARVLLAGALALEGRTERAWALCGEGVSAGLRDALRCAVEWRTAATRAFAYKRDAIEHALSAAPDAGAVLEFGVRYGVSTRVLAARVDGCVHGFDSFLGLPEPWGSLDRGAFSMEGVGPALPANVRVHEGLFADTAPAFAASLSEPLRLVHIDSDLYASARDVFDALGPHIGVGCVLLFDEYFGNERWRDDEHRAFTEASARFGWRTEALSLSWITGQAAFRVTSAAR